MPDPIPELIERGDVAIGLDVVADGLNNPVTATSAPGDNKHLYVAEQNGQIWSVPIDNGHGHGHGHGGKGHRHHRGRGHSDAPRLSPT